VITSSGPGGLVTLRSAGNPAPPSESDTSAAASVEFAVRNPGVPTIMVRGHSGRGALKAMRAKEKPAGPLGVSGWVGAAGRCAAARR
jgi:carbonic anhydrase